MPESSRTTIDLMVSEVTARAHPWPDCPPKSVATLLASLPLELPLQHCRRSRPACFAQSSGGPLAAEGGLENPVTSLYAGVLALRPPTPTLPQTAHRPSHRGIPHAGRPPLRDAARRIGGGAGRLAAALSRTALTHTSILLTAAKAG